MMQSALISLLQALPYDSETARRILPQAFAVHQQVQKAIEERALALPQQKEGGIRIQAVRAELARVKGDLDKIKRELDAAGVSLETTESLQRDLGQLGIALQRLNEFSRMQPRRSPLPLCDRLIGVAANVIDGFVQPAVLEGLIAELDAFIRGLTSDVNRFRVLYPEGTYLVESCEADMRIMQSALKELRTWQSGRDVTTLRGALDGLKQGSTQVVDRLQDMARAVRDQALHSNVLMAEELIRSAQAFLDGKLNDGVFVDLANRVEQLKKTFEAAYRGAFESPLYYAVRPQMAELEQQLRFLDQALEPWSTLLRRDARTAATDTAAIDGIRLALENTTLAKDRLRQEVAAVSKILSTAPQVLAVATAFGGLRGGTSTVQQTRQLADGFIGTLGDMLDQLEAVKTTPEISEMRGLISEEKSAIREMKVYLEDQDEIHLRLGVETLRVVLPRLLAMKRDMSPARAAAPAATVLCIQCGASNSSSSRYCGACNAQLPADSEAETVYTDSVGGEETSPMPANLRKLREIYAMAEAGGQDDMVQAGLIDLMTQLLQVARDYESRLAVRAYLIGDRATNYATEFVPRLVQFIEAVETMYSGSQHARLDWMAQGLHVALTVGEEMQQLQVNLTNNLVS